MPNGDQQVDDQQVNDQHVEHEEHEESTPATWKPPASQEEFDRIIADRLKRETKKYRDYDALKDKATKYDTLSATTQTEHERAIAEAEETGYGAAYSALAPALVKAEFRAAAFRAGLTDEQLEALTEDVDLTRYLDDDGEPDLERIQRKVKAIAPKQAPPSFGQGPRGTGPQGSNMNDLLRQMAGVKQH
jgi:hypothetical protein